MSPKNKNGDLIIEIKIPAITNKEQAANAIKTLLKPIDQNRAEALADEYGIQAYMGEYGEGGQTYYPKGTNVEDNYISRHADMYGINVDENGLTTEGFWLSSSEMC